MKLRYLSLISVSSINLAACGGGSTSESAFSVEGFESDFAQVVGNTVVDFTTTSVAPETLTGVAQFEGILLLPTNTSADELLLGQLRLSADFEQSTLTGGADSFARYDADFDDFDTFADAVTRIEELDGRLDVSDGSLGRIPFEGGDVAAFGGRLGGELQSGDGEYSVDTTFVATIGQSDDSAALVAVGELLGTIEGPEVSLVYGAESGVGGGFTVAAER